MTRKCKVCKSEFTPQKMGQKVCSPDCAISLAVSERGKAIKVAKIKERKTDKIKRETLKTRSDYMKEAQVAFNSYIRERDREKPCICCGLPLSAGDVGGKFDCGHYRSVGSAPHLRFVENNAHGQRKQCNRWGAGRAVDYRLGLIDRIGMEAVDALESDQASRKYTIEELRSIKSTYSVKLRKLKEAQDGR